MRSTSLIDLAPFVSASRMRGLMAEFLFAFQIFGDESAGRNVGIAEARFEY